MNEAEALQILNSKNIEIDCTDNRTYKDIVLGLGLMALRINPDPNAEEQTINKV